ncbi:MAG: hypothetical protein ACSHXZ_14880 [Gammaproteobacteria bacterium]
MGQLPNSTEGRYAQRLDDVLRNFEKFREHVVPLCAAETPISEYVRALSSSELQEKYAMGGPLAPKSGNFIGAENVLELHTLIIDLCKILYGSAYADPRPSTGIGAVTNLLMTLSEPGQTIALQTTASGGHASMAPVCRRLGLDIFDIPYDFERLNFDFEALSELARERKPDFVLLSPSDVLYPPPFQQLRVGSETTILYDATQLLGLISGGVIANPLNTLARFVVVGGTHKTLPGPSSGLILTSNLEIAQLIDSELNPKYLRHSQPNQMAALAACLIEQIGIGEAYARRIRAFSQHLSKSLKTNGLDVIQDGEHASQTHQIFLSLPDGASESVYTRFGKAGITLNTKSKALFRGEGLRLGVQEIARYRWCEDDLDELAMLIANIVHSNGTPEKWSSHVRTLSRLNSFDPNLELDFAQPTLIKSK